MHLHITINSCLLFSNIITTKDTPRRHRSYRVRAYYFVFITQTHVCTVFVITQCICFVFVLSLTICNQLT